MVLFFNFIKALLPTPPRLPIPLMNNRAKPFFSQPRPRSPPPEKTPDTVITDDFDLLLERHKEIQLQLENLEREESAALLDNEDIIDDSFVDIPVDGDGKSGLNLEDSGEGTSGVDSSEINQEKNLPDKFLPFKIKPLRPPIPTLKELSEKKDEDVEQSLDNETTNGDLPSTSDDTVPLNTDRSQADTSSKPNVSASVKRRRRRMRKKKQRVIKKPTVAVNKDIVVSPKDENAKLMEPTTEIEAKLMQLATSSENNEMNLKIR